MPKITGIEKQEKHKKRLNIFVDGLFAVGISEKLIVDFNLFVGKEISKEDLRELEKAESLSKCMDKAYRLLSFKMRTESEMLDRLKEKFDEKTAKEAIKKLKEYNYINDDVYAETFVKTKKTQKGRRAIEFELLKKGIEKELAKEKANEITKEEEIETALLLVKEKKKYQGLPADQKYPKIGGFLARRGYSYDVIKEVLKNI